MRNVGIAVLVGSLALSGLLLVVWLVGLVTALGGGLIHLFLVLAILVGAAGAAAGVVLILVGHSRRPR